MKTRFGAVLTLFALVSCGSPSVEKSRDFEWVEVPPGSFVFGSPENTPCRAAYVEKEVNVTLTRGLVVAKTEVTQRQWESIGLELPSQNKVSPDLPVTHINFFEALKFCNALSEVEGLESCYDLSSCSGSFGASCPMGDDELQYCSCDYSNDSDPCAGIPEVFSCSGEVHRFENWYECPGYRLPTTAEWEYVAKAGTNTHSYNGDLLDNVNGECQDQPNLNDIAWYCHNSEGELHRVGEKRANDWGLHDILGNAYEWVDYFTDGWALDETDGHPGEDLVDPVGTRDGERKDLRGGNYKRTGCYTRSSWQAAQHPTVRRGDTGLRPVRSVLAKK